MPTSQERRLHDRFELPAMYTPIAVKPLEGDDFLYEGHAYDISRGGVRFELDRALEPGTQVVMRIDLPRARIERSTSQRSVMAFATIVWIEDDDQPGPYKTAAVFTGFANGHDEELLVQRIHSGRYAMAA